MLINKINDYFRHETNKIIENKTKELDELKDVLAKIDEKLTKVKEELQEKTTELKNGTK